MASRIAELALAALLGGAAGGGLVHGLAAPAPQDVQAAPDPAGGDETPAEPARADAAAAPESDEPPTADDKRLQDLERKVALLERVIAKRRAAVNGDDEAATRPPADPEDPEFELAVRGVIDKAIEERDSEREQVRLDRREQRVLARVDELADKLGLDDKQVEKVEGILLEQMETFSALRNSNDRPQTRREWRARADAIHAETATKLGEFLNEEQLAGYQDYMAEERGNRRGRGRR